MSPNRRNSLSAVLASFLILALGAACQTTPPPAAPAEDPPPAPEENTPDEAPTPEAPAPEEAEPVEEEVVEEDPLAAPEGPLTGKNVVFLVGEGFHDGETFIPMAYLYNRGANVRVIGVEQGPVTAYNSDITVMVEMPVGDVSIDDIDAMVIPGGQSPDWLRQHEEVVELAGDFFRADGLTAAICHGPQVLVTAGVLEGREATCFPDMKEELEEVGAVYDDVEVQRDENLITSRNPDDIPAFSRTIEEALLE